MEFNIYLMIIKYSDFLDPQILHLFDFDKTLANTPDYNGLVIDFLNEDIEQLLNRSMSFINIKKHQLKIGDGRIWVDDPKKEINIRGNWVRKKSRIYMVEPNIYGNMKISKPKSVTKLAKFYNSTPNKMIITARPESSRSLIESCFDELGLDKPLKMWMLPPNEKSQRIWKAKIVKSIMSKGEYKGYRFYDDKPKIVREVNRTISRYFPDIDFKSYKITI